MADEKKPVDGIEDGADTQAPRTPETVNEELLGDGAGKAEDDAPAKEAEPEATASVETDENTDIHSAGEAALAEEEAAEAEAVPDTDETAEAEDKDAPVPDDTDASAPDDEDAPVPDDGSTIDANSPSAIDGTVEAPAPEAATAAAAVPPAAEQRPAPSSPPQVIEKTIVEKKGGFVPMLLGGVIAAGIGYGVATYQAGGFGTVPNPFEDETRASLTDQSARIDALAAEVKTATDTANGIDLSALEASVSDLQSQIDAASGSSAELSERLDAFTARLDAIEKRPLEQISPEAVAAFERELDTLREAVALQKTQVEDMTQQALDAEANAEQLAALSKARAALAEASAAIVAGAPYAAQLAIIEANGVSVPAALSAPAEDGAPTLPELTEEYPPLAREALAIARRDETEGSSGTARFSTFLENQLGVRSVTPRDGDGADAILSRAEAALKGGDLATALSELNSLPDEAKAPLSDWMAKAQTRADAVGAAESLAQELNKE
ncbi:mitofilin family membrane protein [Salipiger sp. 1_MG-2023]|uniref:COG4223 family protein n=1 Tax=Salipiger sp. 1_MG-2023 TaxID=3062665 RepID=UPI0026E3DDF2|nr:mitofilin family membrane protein [Salipiger sp. 1_MG-2023]MDO6584277.1 mitofilin family membrane protein [Salipiger sp. 1_MG-2023]